MRICSAALARLRTWGVLGVVLAAGIWFLVSDVTATIAEHDLTRIGNGIPAVVQIHDPCCSSCVALQGEAREAMEEFGRDELQYLVADINNAAGRNLANVMAWKVSSCCCLTVRDKDAKRWRAPTPAAFSRTVSGPTATGTGPGAGHPNGPILDPSTVLYYARVMNTQVYRLIRSLGFSNHPAP